MQMLFDPFEEKFNLPSFTVQLRYGQSRQIEVIGHKSVNNARGIALRNFVSVKLD